MQFVEGRGLLSARRSFLRTFIFPERKEAGATHCRVFLLSRINALPNGSVIRGNRAAQANTDLARGLCALPSNQLFGVDAFTLHLRSY